MKLAKKCRTKFGHTRQKRYLCHTKLLDMNNKTPNITHWTISLLLGAFSFCWWWKGHPEVLSWHEQNQMFRYAADYFWSRAAMPGGICAYASEWLTQFYYYPTVGAAILALFMMGIYGSTSHLLSRMNTSQRASSTLALTVPCTLWCMMGDEQIMLSYTCAFWAALFLSEWILKRRNRCLTSIVLIIGYYLLGPIAWMIPLAHIVGELYLHHTPRSVLCSMMLYAMLTFGCLGISYYVIDPSHPWAVIWQGIFYYRSIIFDLEAPAALWILPLVIPVLMWLCQIVNKDKYVIVLSMLIVGTTGGGLVYSYDTDKYEQLRQDYLIRSGKWEQILADAKHHQPHTEMSSSAVNLALAMTGQMPNKLFEYYQCGIDGLILMQKRDNIQMLPTMEAFYRLGLINLAQWYAFEAQQAIPNQNQSARLTKRLAECNLINGRYDVAQKYIDLLKQTQFYSHWAVKAEQLLWDDVLIGQHNEYGRLRRYMPTAVDDCLYPHPEIEKIIGRLYMRNESNTMAMNYFLSALLLKGMREEFVGYLIPELQRLEDPFPRGYKEYYIMMKKRYQSGQLRTPDAVTGATVQ